MFIMFSVFRYMKYEVDCAVADRGGGGGGEGCQYKWWGAAANSKLKLQPPS